MPISTPRYATGSIAGIDLMDGANPLRVVLLDFDRLASAWRGTDKVSPDGTVHVKLNRTDVRARRFGIQLDFCPAALLAQIEAAIEAALDAGNSFLVSVTDDTRSKTLACAPDFKAGDWLTHDPAASFGGKVRNVIFRFVSLDAGA